MASLPVLSREVCRMLVYVCLNETQSMPLTGNRTSLVLAFVIVTILAMSV
jgi:hypothetical protein